MKQTLNVEIGNYNISITDESLSETFAEILAFTSDKKSYL